MQEILFPQESLEHISQPFCKYSKISIISLGGQIDIIVFTHGISEEETSSPLLKAHLF